VGHIHTQSPVYYGPPPQALDSGASRSVSSQAIPHDKPPYQMGPGNGREALIEALLDEQARGFRHSDVKAYALTTTIDLRQETERRESPPTTSQRRIKRRW